MMLLSNDREFILFLGERYFQTIPFFLKNKAQLWPLAEVYGLLFMGI